MTKPFGGVANIFPLLSLLAGALAGTIVVMGRNNKPFSDTTR